MSENSLLDEVRVQELAKKAEIEKLKADVEALTDIVAYLNDALKYMTKFNDSDAAERKRKAAEIKLINHFLDE